MPVSGIVIRVDVAQRDSVEAALVGLAGLEVTPTPPGDTLVAVIDTPSVEDEEALFTQVGGLPGVQKVSLSYHNFEDLVGQ